MSSSLFRIRWPVLFVAACAWAQASAAWADEPAAPVAGTRPAVTALTPDAAASAPASGAAGEDVQSTVAELMQMLHDGKIVEMRTTYNGSYGASLMFYPAEMTYYVALFQDKHFWRVIKSQEKPRAEMIYANFSEQTAQLADVEIRRTELVAQKAFLERVIALSEEHARRLQADLSVARAQQAQVAEHQQSAQSEARALDVQQRAAQAQLRDLQRQVQQLQQQTESGGAVPVR
ncbi:DUF2968 domain-containing protein [Burkholderia alba]|uniref:DUF2968 domain-containing protein n=1 Tax=Burkholderia alba TaxID=2683677 RepID=UPI002B0519A8|nr:DUF2968 domain-containing protein [Burkholderia alba]